MLFSDKPKGKLRPSLYACKFRVGQKVMIVEDAMHFKYPTPLRGYTIHTVRKEQDREKMKDVFSYQIVQNGIVSEFLQERQLAFETPPPPVSLNDKVIHGDEIDEV